MIDAKAPGRKALFLDRDGVVNVDHGYVYRVDQVQFLDGIFDLVRHARERGYAVVVVTNQAGIGRGYYTEDDFLSLSAWMLEEFERRGAPVDRIYHCPSHPEHGVGEHRCDSPMRKPHPGMLLQAAKDLGLWLPGSVMVGDKESDIVAGVRAGVARTILVDSSAKSILPGHSTRADVVVSTLADIHAYLP